MVVSIGFLILFLVNIKNRFVFKIPTLKVGLISVLGSVLYLFSCNGVLLDTKGIVLVVLSVISSLFLYQSISDMYNSDVADKYLNAVMVMLIVLLLIAGVLSLRTGYFTNDEAYTIGAIKNSYGGIVNICKSDVHPPLYYFIYKFVYTFFENNPSVFVKTVVGKAVSFVPVILLMIIMYFHERKNRRFAILSVLLIIGLPNVLSHAEFIRMYTWAAFFVTISYLLALDILGGKGDLKCWIGLTIFSLLSGYTHYFALISVSVLWLYLLFYLLKNKKEYLKKWVLFAAITVGCYLPWAVVLLQQFGRVSQNYWISEITWKDLLGYVKFVLANGAFLILWFSVYVICKNKNIHLTYKETLGSSMLVFTAVTGITVSILVKPVFIDRYLVPSLFVFWLSFVPLLKQMDRKDQNVIIALIILSSALNGVSFAKEQFNEKLKIDNTMKLLDRMDATDSVIVIPATNDNHFISVLAAMTDDIPIYEYQFNLGSLGSNMISQIDDASTVHEMLEEGKTVYYCKCSFDDDLYTDESLSFEYIGTYCFESDYTWHIVTEAE